MKKVVEDNRHNQPSPACCPDCGATLRQKMKHYNSQVMEIWCPDCPFRRDINRELKTIQQQRRDQVAHHQHRKQPNLPAVERMHISYPKPPTEPLHDEGE